jgi:hypothetical protein
MPPTLTCDSSRVILILATLLRIPQSQLELPRVAASPNPPSWITPE